MTYYINYPTENAKLRLVSETDEVFVKFDNGPERKVDLHSNFVTDARTQGKRITEKEYLTESEN